MRGSRLNVGAMENPLIRSNICHCNSLAILMEIMCLPHGSYRPTLSYSMKR
ncbi:hypothetical protein GGD70_003957 [Paraburkholderia fungorum]|nr:hypothetical protein [Paraburkholderia fungorum]